MKKKIIVQWFKCSEEKKKMFGYDNEMYVVDSNHPLFVFGTRFDFGFIERASEDGYIIELIPLTTK